MIETTHLLEFAPLLIGSAIAAVLALEIRRARRKKRLNDLDRRERLQKI